jgi:ubiquitin-like-conjugating enzyme ATG3
LSITYDKYFYTPRLWLQGYSASGEILGAKELVEDVMAEYANKTVTFEKHPHTDII